jgi:hypothetical protein
MIHDEAGRRRYIYGSMSGVTRRHGLAPSLAKHLGSRFVVFNFERGASAT